MSDETASGWPYPEGTDRVMDGDDMMHDTADLLEVRVGGGFASGIAVIDAPPATDTPVRLKVDFPAGRFTDVPVIALGVRALDPQKVQVAVEIDPARPVTADHFYLIGSRSAVPLAPITVDWIAHQPSA